MITGVSASLGRIAPQDLEPVHLGHLNVEQDECSDATPDTAQTLDAVVSDRDLESFGLCDRRDQATGDRVVIDDEQFPHGEPTMANVP